MLVGHSLGTVVAYGALCAHPEWLVRALGVLRVIFERRQPRPARAAEGARGSTGRWPGPVRAWTNAADAGDVAALVRDLRPQFGPRMESCLVDNGVRASAISPFLTAQETGAAIAAALAGSGGRV